MAEESRFSVSADFEKDVQETRAASFISGSYMQHLCLLPGAGPGPGAWELRGSAQSSRRGRTCKAEFHSAAQSAAGVCISDSDIGVVWGDFTPGLRAGVLYMTIPAGHLERCLAYSKCLRNIGFCGIL